MTASADITQALEQAGPVAKGFRRWVVVGISAGLALGAEMAVRGTWTPDVPCGHWVTRVPPQLWGVAIVPCNQFPGWSIVDRPRILTEVEVACDA